MIDRQIYRRAALTSFDVDPQVDRSLSLASRSSARSFVRTVPKKGHRGALHCSSFIGRPISSAEPHPGSGAEAIRSHPHTLSPHR